MCPPVLICGFRRPDCLKQVFDKVREAEPTQLFLALDAPRANRSDDVQRCEACKKIFERVDWPCEVRRNYATANMGCRKRMESAISWVFEHVDYAIILEDDCVPDLTFFRFCDELLKKYEQDPRVGVIAGHCQYPSYIVKKPAFYGEQSYYCDYMNTIWGWATWKRAWSHYDDRLRSWQGFVERGGLSCITRSKRAVKRLLRLISDSQEGRTSSWAIIWWACCVQFGMLCIHPTSNLVTNVGFGDGATHTKAGGKSPWANLPIEPMRFPLCHPDRIKVNMESQQELLDNMYAVPFWRRVKGRVLRLLRR